MKERASRCFLVAVLLLLFHLHSCSASLLFIYLLYIFCIVARCHSREQRFILCKWLIVVTYSSVGMSIVFQFNENFLWLLWKLHVIHCFAVVFDLLFQQKIIDLVWNRSWYQAIVSLFSDLSVLVFIPIECSVRSTVTAVGFLLRILLLKRSLLFVDFVLISFSILHFFLSTVLSVIVCSIQFANSDL